MSDIHGVHEGSTPRVRAAEVALACALTLLPALWYAVTDTGPLFWDEYYHLLAARSWATDGSLSIGDGAYTRASWLSVSLGVLFRVFGESIELARIAAASILTMWVGLIFTWTYREVGRFAAWATALIFALSPLVLIWAVMVRFYGVAGVLLMLVTWALYRATAPDHRGRARPVLLLAAAAVGALVLYYGVTRLSRVWLVGPALWVAGVGIFRGLRSRRGAQLVAVVALVAVAALAVAWFSGWIAETWAVYRAAPGWRPERASDLRWYEGMFRGLYPTLWTLLPVAVILAVGRRARPAGFWLCTLVVGIALLTGAGPKAERYALPLLPFFFMLWGTALAELAPIVSSWIAGMLDRLKSDFPLVPTGRWVHALGLVVVLGFVLGTNPGFSRWRHMLQGRVTSLDLPPRGLSVSPGEWDRVAPQLGRAGREASVVVTANSLQTLYHVGDYDYAIRPTVLKEIAESEEFGVDPREGRPVISTVESLERLIENNPSGLVFGERWRWGDSTEGFTPAVAEFVRTTMIPVTLEPEVGIVAYRWGPLR